MKSDNPKEFQTLLIITTGLLLIFFVYHIACAIQISFLIGISGIFFPFIRKTIVWLWDKLSGILSYIMPVIILTFIFFIVLTPIAILFRRSHKNILNLKNNKESLFIKGTETVDASSFEKTW